MSPTQQVSDGALPPAVSQGQRANAAPKRRPRKIKALRELNPEQEAAVTHPPGMILVIAGAGSGKTRVLTRRGAFLIDVRGVDPESLLFITLTNKAAREMVNRLHKLCGPAAERIHAGTFHSMCAGVLRIHAKLIGRTSQFSIYDKDEAKGRGQAAHAGGEVASGQGTASDIGREEPRRDRGAVCVVRDRPDESFDRAGVA